LTASGVWAQQDATRSASGPESGRAVSSAPEGPHHWSDKNRIAECPANLNPTSAPGLYKVGGNVKPPRVLHFAEAEFTKQALKAAKRNKLNGSNHAICFISLVVDTNGVPQELCVYRPAGFGLDEQAANAVSQYRFEPATKSDGSPVPARITVEVNFRLY
jgi:TonB family protein